MTIDMDDVFVIFATALFLTLPASWITHVVWVIRCLASSEGVTGGQAVLGVAGTLFPPIGVVHGYLIWFS